MDSALHYLDYRVLWRVAGIHPGRHRSRAWGEGSEFRGHSPWYQARDLRRFDVRASLRDPLGRLMVRDYTQRSAVPVHILADLSASMTFRGRCSKLGLLSDFAASLAYSAYRGGDPFAITGCGDRVAGEWSLPLRLARGYGVELARRLKSAKTRDTSARGLLEGAERVGSKRSLVFVVSDYHLPLELVGDILGHLHRHQVVPVVLRDSAEFRLPAQNGIAWLRDLETGRRRVLWVRPRLRERLAAAVSQRREALEALFLKFHSKPLVIEDRFRADEVNRYFWA